MTLQGIYSEDQLVAELWARDVRFLMGSHPQTAPLLAPANLIASLAQSANARVRLSLIPLFLSHPEFSADAEKADKSLLAPPSQLVLRFYYTAAIILQRKYWERLGKLFTKQMQLPDLFSKKMGVLLGENPDEALTSLAKRHQVLSGQAINWRGTYEHAAERLIKHMEKFK
jgi:hypothetical protein